jgi:hypothetical protein
VISALELKMKEFYIYTPFPFPLLRHFWHAWVREEFGEVICIFVGVIAQGA